MRGMQKGGFVDVIAFPNHPHLVERKTTIGDLGQIARWAGGNDKGRFEFGTMSGRRPRAIRATHGHSRNIGAVGDSLPIASDVV